MADLLGAARVGDFARVKQLVRDGADVTARNKIGWSALLQAAMGQLGQAHGHLKLVQWLLEEGGSSITETATHGLFTVWNLLTIEGANARKLSSLLKVMALLGDAPADFIARLRSKQSKIIMRGRQLRALLDQQRSLIVAHCPLPSVLQTIVTAFAATSPKDLWTDELRAQAPRTKRARAEPALAEVGENDDSRALRRSRRLRQKQS
jgi:hypothetical protein